MGLYDWSGSETNAQDPEVLVWVGSAAFFFILRFYFCSNVYTHCGTRTYNPEIKSGMLHQLSQAPLEAFIVWGYL